MSDDEPRIQLAILLGITMESDLSVDGLFRSARKRIKALEKENREIKTAYDLRGEGLNELHVRIHDLEKQRDETQRCLEGETKQRRKLEQEKAELRERLRGQL